jgi:hypothetical protein
MHSLSDKEAAERVKWRLLGYDAWEEEFIRLCMWAYFSGLSSGLGLDKTGREYWGAPGKLTPLEAVKAFGKDRSFFLHEPWPDGDTDGLVRRKGGGWAYR